MELLEAEAEREFGRYHSIAVIQAGSRFRPH
jgi:hypothetical protein